MSNSAVTFYYRSTALMVGCWIAGGLIGWSGFMLLGTHLSFTIESWSPPEAVAAAMAIWLVLGSGFGFVVGGVIWVTMMTAGGGALHGK
jgi:hypothetical protein